MQARPRSCTATTAPTTPRSRGRTCTARPARRSPSLTARRPGCVLAGCCCPPACALVLSCCVLRLLAACLRVSSPECVARVRAHGCVLACKHFHVLLIRDAVYCVACRFSTSCPTTPAAVPSGSRSGEYCTLRLPFCQCLATYLCAPMHGLQLISSLSFVYSVPDDHFAVVANKFIITEVLRLTG